MTQRIRRNLSFANVVSMLALTIALGGTSYAATTLAKNSVGSAQIRAKAVRNSDLGSSSVSSSKVKDGSLLKKDFAANQLPAGATGLKGDKGDRGERGATGAFGVVTTVSFTAAADLSDGTKASYNAFCPAGQQAIGGGARGDDTASEGTSVTSSRPAVSTTNTEPPADGGSFTGWRITVLNPAGGITTGIRPTVWVICAPAPVA